MVVATGRKKDSINATVSPSLKKKVIEAVERGEYSSMSDVVAQALNKLFSEEQREHHALRPANREGLDEKQFEREIWKQKGEAYQKMGKLRDAIECYDKALGIEKEKPAPTDPIPYEITRKVIIE